MLFEMGTKLTIQEGTGFLRLPQVYVRKRIPQLMIIMYYIGKIARALIYTSVLQIS